MDPTLKCLFAGARKNPACPFYKLPKDLVRLLYGYIVDARQSHIIEDTIAFCLVQDSIPFPPFTGINVNMLPFIVSRETATLPRELHSYIPLISQCFHGGGTARGSVAYLTVHESFVKRGETQRRPGIHIEQPLHRMETCNQKLGFLPYGWGEGSHLEQRSKGIYVATNVPDSSAAWNVEIDNLPGLMGADAKEGGNTIDFLKRQLDKTVERANMPTRLIAEQKADAMKYAEDGREMEMAYRKYRRENAGEIAREWETYAEEGLGDYNEQEDIEQHLRFKRDRIAHDRRQKDAVRAAKRPFYQVLEPNCIYWMTDWTPHCALPVPYDCNRTFFRLVCGKVGIRWTDDCTPNPLVKLPDDVLLIDGSKFSAGGDEEKRPKINA